MSDRGIAQQLADLLPRMARGGKLFWRSFGAAVHSPVLAQLAPTRVDAPDRVGWYLSQWVAEAPYEAARVRSSSGESRCKVDGVSNTKDFGHFLHEGTTYLPANSLLDDACVCYQMALHAARTQKDVVAFYRAQGSRYDGFREALLPGRERLMRFSLPWHQSPATCLSVGCGTARDLEYVLGHVRACGTRLWLLDLSVDLLAMAKLRVDKLGIAHLVTLITGDICDPTLAGLPHVGTIDMVTCSYCLTMIPSWRTALDVMVRLLRPGGQLAIVDFTCRSDRLEMHWSQRLNRWWFANDGVFLNGEHVAALRSMTDLKTVWVNEFEQRVVYTLLVATSYIFIGLKL